MTTPELAVSMPARNAGRFIGAAIESVLQQEGVDLELIVIDDASSDDTTAVVSRFTDPRLRHVRNDRRRGIGWCHNEALRLTRAPFIAHADADDLVLPGALRALVDAARGPHVGQAYCDFHTIDQAGQASPEAIARWVAFFREQRRPPIDYRRELLVHGMVVNHLRTYPRHALERAGGFAEDLPFAVDYEMALRLAEHFDFAHVPRQLYAKRVHPGGATEGLRFKGLRFWLMRNRIVNRRARAQRGTLLGHGAGRRYRYLATGLLYELGAGRLWRSLHRLGR
jgi:glycosyltransferase involved in cell wall biosynthesis